METVLLCAKRRRLILSELCFINNFRKSTANPKNPRGITYNFTPMQQKVVRVSKFSEHRHKTHDVKEQGKKNPDRDKPQRKKIKLVTTVGMV